MTLFRSEEEVPATGETMSAGLLHELARRWYGDRLDPEWRPRAAADAQAILDELGLRGAFWRLDA
jgi:hypothetical protein